VTEDDVLLFIAASIGSVWALELLLLLKRDPNQAWNRESLVRELRSSPVVIDEALQQLQGAGLVTEDGAGAFRYHAASPELNAMAFELEKTYAAKPMTVIKAIVNARTDKLRVFSDAFKLKD
jgi:DNA-binding GntR family transcriptional regulator